MTDHPEAAGEPAGAGGPKGYILAQVRVRDDEAYAAYRARTPAIIASYGGRFLVRGGAVERLEGDLDLSRVVILEFPSPQRARDFYDSPEYQAILALRTDNADSQFYIIEGWAGPQPDGA